MIKFVDVIIKTSDYDIKNLIVMQKVLGLFGPLKLDMWTEYLQLKSCDKLETLLSKLNYKVFNSSCKGTANSFCYCLLICNEIGSRRRMKREVLLILLLLAWQTSGKIIKKLYN